MCQMGKRIDSRGAPFKSDRCNDHKPAIYHYSEGGTSRIMKKDQVLKRLERAWATLQDSYAALSDPQLMEAANTGEWSVKAIRALVTN